MVKQYQKWLEIKVSHQYFSIGDHGLELVTTQSAINTLKNWDIRFHKNSGSFEFYIGTLSGETDLDTKLENLGIIELYLRSSDPLFHNYTVLPALDQGEHLVFLNIGDSAYIQAEIANTDFEDDRLLGKSIGLLKINTAYLTSKELSLQFNARRVIHQYYLVNPNPDRMEIIELEIIDANNNRYIKGEEVILPNGQKALTYISQELVQLQSKYNENPKLSLKYKNKFNKEEELKMELPNPSPEMLKISDDGQWVASTYVYL